MKATGRPDRRHRHGRHLDTAIRAQFEPVLGADMRDVRVHNDRTATLGTQLLGTRAFTHGTDISFADGQFRPETPTGRRALAHELAHVVQQREPGSNQVSTQSIEADAHETATLATAGVARRPRTRDEPGTLRCLAGDARVMSITPQWAGVLTDEELTTQIDLLAAQISTLPAASPEFETARENQSILQSEQVRRLVQGRGQSADDDTVHGKHVRFQQAVLLAAQYRLAQNRENLQQWRALIESQLDAADLQTQVLAQSASDLQQTARTTGGMRVYNEWAGQRNPYMRNVEEHQARGQWRACTGCHEIVRAGYLGSLEPHTGTAWMSPAERLSGLAGISRTPMPATGFATDNTAWVQAAIDRIKPIVAPLGDYGYRIIPDDVFSLSSGEGPDELRARILQRLEARRRDYAKLSRLIANGDISYLQLAPVLQDLLPMAEADVRKAVQDDIDRQRISAYIHIGETIILALLSLLFPPLTLAVGAMMITAGYESFQLGHAYHLGTGANEVLTREQQDQAGSMMASGVLNMTMAAAAIVASTPGVLDMAATRAITASDLAIARNLATRALDGPIAEAELLQLQQPGLVGRLAFRWADLRDFQVLYRGQMSPTSEIVSPVARQSGVAGSRQLYNAMKAEGLTDLEIAGYTARWSGEPVPAFSAPPGLGGQPLGGVGIPTTRLPNIAADFARSPTGVVYVLRVPKGLPVPARGWGMQSTLEQEWVIFHQIPNGMVVRVLPQGSLPSPLRFDFPARGAPSLTLPPP